MLIKPAILYEHPTYEQLTRGADVYELRSDRFLLRIRLRDAYEQQSTIIPVMTGIARNSLIAPAQPIGPPDARVIGCTHKSADRSSLRRTKGAQQGHRQHDGRGPHGACAF